MKNFLLFTLIAFVTLSLNAQNVGTTKNVVLGANWTKKSNGHISKSVYNNNSLTGWYTQTNGEKIYVIGWDRPDLATRIMIKFFENEYSAVNRNWLKLAKGHHVWFTEAEYNGFQTLTTGLNQTTGTVDACGNTGLVQITNSQDDMSTKLTNPKTGNTYTTINHNYYSNTDGSTTTTNPDLHQGEAVFIGNNNQFTSPSSCYGPEAEYNIIEDGYDDKKITRREAKQIFIELQLMYPYCLGNKDFSKVWRNDGEHVISGAVGFIMGYTADQYQFNARQRFQSQNPNSPYRYNDSGFEKWGINARDRNGLISNRRNKVASNNFRKLSSNIRNVKASSGNIRSSVTTRNSENYSRGTRKTRSTASSLRTNTTTKGTRTQPRKRSNGSYGSSSSRSKGTTRASSSYSSRFGRGQRQRGNY